MVRFGSMSYSDQASPTSRASSSNSGAQYATAALGVGLIALGVVMIVWSVVPAGSAGNTSTNMDSSQIRDTSSVAFVLSGGGVALLLLSVCLSVRNKRRSTRAQEATATPANPQEEGARTEQFSQNFTVPTYEEVVGSERYPVSQAAVRNNSTTQLPAYEEIEEDQHIMEDASSQARRPSGQMDPSNGRRNSRPGRKLIPLKIRRIKSENVRRKSLSDVQQTSVFTIEPLTPPPQYDDKPLPLTADSPQ